MSSALQVILLSAAIRLFAVLPFWALYALADGLYLLLYHGLRYRRKIVQRNLAKSFPNSPPGHLLQLRKKYYRHLCALLVESIKGFSLSEKELRRRFFYLNPEVFQPWFDRGQSVILFSSHYGNWEWGSLSLPLIMPHQMVGIYKPLSNRRLNARLHQWRSRWGTRLVPMTQIGRTVVRLRDQPCVFGFLADQTPLDVKNAHWLTFLQQDTPFLHGAEKLARRTGYPVYFADIRRVKRGFYETTFRLLTDDPAALSPGEITARYAAALEAAILDKPPYWLWSHRRWKRKRPPA